MTAHLEDTTLVVREIFYAVQGEGARTGEPSVFLRFAGCNLDCWFCDTDWQRGDRLTLGQVLALIARAHAPAPPTWAVLTGGEPTFAPAFDPLVMALKERGYRIQVETNGTRWRDALDFCYVTCSPKAKWEGEAAALDPRVVHAVSEFKYVIEAGDELPVLPPLDDPKRRPPLLFLQPRYDQRDAWQRALDLVRLHPEWRLSLQTQKWIGCR